MKKTVLLITMAVLLSVLSSCVSSKQEDLFTQVKNIPAKHYNSYTFNPESSLESRIQEAPGFVLDYLNRMDNVDYYTSYSPTNEEMEIFTAYMDLLPPLNKKILKEKNIGIYFINNFIGSGMADYVVDDERNIYTLLFINPDTLKTGMNEWMDYRENTCFIEDDSTSRVEIECGDEYLGLLYLLLHETTHIADYITSLTPYTELTSSLIRNETIDWNKPFIRGIWTDYRNQAEAYRKDFTGQVTFYGLGGGPKLEKSGMEEIYSDLMKTPFASLYASQNWAEDLAELETWYHYTEILEQPYKIVLYKNNEIAHIYEPMENKLVRERFTLLGPLYEE